MMLQDVLKKIGFSVSEANVYLSLLPIGTAPASVIAKKAGMSRTNTRDICKQFVRKGLFSETQRANTFFYSIEPPEKIFYLIDEQQKILDEKKIELERNLSKIKALIDPETILPRVKFYEGKSVLKAYRGVLDNLKIGKEMKTFSKLLDPKEDPQNYFPLIEKMIHERTKKNITMKLLIPKTKLGKEYKNKDKDFLRETRFIPSKNLNFSAKEVTIYGNQIFTFSFSEDGAFCLVVENKEIAQMYHSLFDLVWENGKS